MSTVPTACVDIVIPTYRAAALVERCVEYLADASIATRIVVDDASGDDTIERLAGRAGIKTVGLREQRGLSHALNCGAAEATAPLLLFLNNDIFPAPGAIDRLVAGFLAADGASSAAGRLVDEGTHLTQDTYLPRAIPGPLAVVARLTGVERLWPRNPVTGQHLRKPLPDDRPTLTDRQPAGACLLVRRADHERLGGWDERYWIWYEDVDFSRRLLALGRALYDPQALFAHVGGASTGHWNKPDQHQRLYYGTMQYGAIHFGRAGRAVLGATAVLVALPRIARYARRDPSSAAVYRTLARSGLALLRGADVSRPRHSVIIGFPAPPSAAVHSAPPRADRP